MFKKVNIQKMIKEHQEYQDLAHEMKKYANSIRSKSKKVTQLLRRDQMKESERLLKEVEGEMKQAYAKAKKNLSVLGEGYYREAIEEYVEAKVYHAFIKGIETIFPAYVRVSLVDKVGGLADFTGELVRKAMTLASKENMSKIEGYKDLMEEMIGELSQASFTGKLRSKYDDLERNLKKLEGILYDIRKK